MMELIALLAGYLLGSVPFGIVIARALGLGDLRKIGSGNIGATNVLRTGHKGAAFATLILDAGKGGIAVLIASVLFSNPQAAPLAGLGAFIGHLFPVWLGFKGGKGVATFLGILLALNFLAGLVTCLTWLVVAIATRISSGSALVASLVSPIWMMAADSYSFAWAPAIMAALIWYAHRANIKRIQDGTEPTISFKKPA